MAAPKDKREYPSGPRDQMTPKWKADVKAALARNKKARKDPKSETALGKSVGLSKGMIGRMLKIEPGKRGQVSGSAVAEISKALDIDPPMIDASTIDEPLIARVAGLTPEQKLRLEAFLDGMGVPG